MKTLVLTFLLALSLPSFAEGFIFNLNIADVNAKPKNYSETAITGSFSWVSESGIGAGISLLHTNNFSDRTVTGSGEGKLDVFNRYTLDAISLDVVDVTKVGDSFELISKVGVTRTDYKHVYKEKYTENDVTEILTNDVIDSGDDLGVHLSTGIYYVIKNVSWGVGVDYYKTSNHKILSPSLGINIKF